MTNTLRIKSSLPVALRISEPHPDPAHPGNSPQLKHAILYPGVNEGIDADLFKAWSESHNAGLVASADDVKAGKTDGKVYEMTDDEPEREFGFQPALDRAADVGKADAEKGSTLTDAGPVKSEDMKTGSADTTYVPVLTAAEPLKTPVTTDAPKPDHQGA